MALFNLGKKKEEEKKAPACACSCGCSASEAEENTNDCCPEAKDGICCIKVLGAGCKSCHEQYENAKKNGKSDGFIYGSGIYHGYAKGNGIRRNEYARHCSQ